MGCVHACREGAIAHPGLLPILDPARCVRCGACTRVCLSGTFQVGCRGWRCRSAKARAATPPRDGASRPLLPRGRPRGHRLLPRPLPAPLPCGERFGDLLERVGEEVLTACIRERATPARRYRRGPRPPSSAGRYQRSLFKGFGRVHSLRCGIHLEDRPPVCLKGAIPRRKSMATGRTHETRRRCRAGSGRGRKRRREADHGIQAVSLHLGVGDGGAPRQDRRPDLRRGARRDPRRRPYGRVACETIVTTGLAFVAGEITTKTTSTSRGSSATHQEIGYTDAAYGFDYETCGVLNAIQGQSPDIAMASTRRRTTSRGRATRG